MTTRVWVALDLDRTDDEPGRAPSAEAVREEVEAIMENTVVEVEGRTWDVTVVGIGATRAAVEESIVLRRQR